MPVAPHASGSDWGSSGWGWGCWCLQAWYGKVRVEAVAKARQVKVKIVILAGVVQKGEPEGTLRMKRV